MTESQREAAFPVHIDLGKEEHPMDLPSGNVTRGTKSNKRTFYPTLYIENIPGLEQLPKEGCMLVEFKRKRLSLEENQDGEDTAGVTLEIQALCLPQDMADEGTQDLADVMQKYTPGGDSEDQTDEQGADDEEE